MGSDEHNKVIAFDTLFSTNHIQMLKVMLPYLDNQMQKIMAIYIKFLELNYTIDFYRRNPYSVCGCMEKEPSFDLAKMCSELCPYCTAEEKKQIEQMRNIFQGIEMYKEMAKTMEQVKDFMPDMGSFSGFPFGNTASSSESDSSSGSGGFDMMNLLMNMLSPEQKQMFDMFGGNQHDE